MVQYLVQYWVQYWVQYLVRRCMMHDAWCMMRDTWCIMYGAWCMMHDATPIWISCAPEPLSEASSSTNQKLRKKDRKSKAQTRHTQKLTCRSRANFVSAGQKYFLITRNCIAIGKLNTKKQSLFCKVIALKIHQRYIVTFMVGKAHILQWNRLKKPSQIENDFQFHINPNFIIRNKAICWKQPPSRIFYYHPMLSLCNILK